ncbi:efflux RND transporter periplasmic adaptor subunit [Frateuria soli]|uniref:efflux RND transporter periplasmic adaptor subunit n=1 Tax=Frateuria soli TaxID=1542730 RepID=UPI001E3CC5F1|nr:efflux RND transporter periplasmic adaptor subunit [Frateuria soli]UGB39540.1 efflux RND transporter periplasmic adaptor subunit [Frateuria soli]
MKRPLILLALVALALALLAAGYLVGRRQVPAAPAGTDVAIKPQRKVLYWYDPMVPGQHFDHPGLSPMGMQTVPRYADGESAGSVRIDPATVQNLGIRTATVERRSLTATIDVPATVGWDLRQASTVSARVDAIVRQLYVRAPYTRVAEGEPLAELLAPQWSSAIAEYRALQHAQSADGRALRAAARARLDAMGLSAADLRSASGGPGATITLHAPQAGVVASLEVREGQRVGAGQTLMTVNGLSTVWIEAALPQGLAGTVRNGTLASVTTDAAPGRTFHGSVESLLPEVDAATRTQRVRIVVDNADGALSPGMFASVRLQPAAAKSWPVVPDDALIVAGADSSRVILAEGEGRFRAVAVRTGRSAGGYTEILKGLRGGERVVVSGQFLIDSEASLSGALDRLGGADRAPVPPAHLHDAHGKPAASSSAAMPGAHTGKHP